MHANNETGVVFPIEQLSRLVKETDPSILFHTDATQSVGKIAIDLRHGLPHVDLLSFSGHKLHAPKGVGALYIKRGTPCRPLLIGGHQEEGRRAGTENVAYIVGLAKAVELAAADMEEEQTRVRALRDRLEAALEQLIPRPGQRQVRPAAAQHAEPLLPLRRGRGDALSAQRLRHLRSSGSACTSGSLEPSHVLRAMKVPFTAVHGSIRFSFSRYNTEEDVDRIIEVFPASWRISAACRRIGTRSRTPPRRRRRIIQGKRP